MTVEEIIKKQSPSSNEAIQVIQEYLTDIKREDVEFAKFISHPQAGQIFESTKFKKINTEMVMNNPQLMMATINDFFNHCYKVAYDHFRNKLGMDNFRCFDKNGVFLFAY